MTQIATFPGHGADCHISRSWRILLDDAAYDKSNAQKDTENHNTGCLILFLQRHIKIEFPVYQIN